MSRVNEYGTDSARANPLAMQYHFYLTKPLRNDDNVMNLIHTLREASPRDNVVIHINCPGGHLSTTAQLITAIRDSNAQVTTSAEGQVYSGASAIFFSGHNFSVSELADFMLHDASGGEVGKFNDIAKSAEHSKRYLHKVYHSAYSPFFSKEEIDSVLDGNDMWLDAEEVSGRIDRVQKELNDRYSRQ